MKRTSKYQSFARVCAIILDLENPYRLRVFRGETFFDRDNGECWGTYQLLEDGSHSINIASKNKLWRMTIAHEFLHAWIAENHPRAENHGRTFQRMAARFRASLRDLGYSVDPLYRKDYDM